jgi:hypothetical protein
MMLYVQKEIAMNHQFNPIFILLCMYVIVGGTVRGAWFIYSESSSITWYWVLVAMATPVLFVNRVFSDNFALAKTATFAISGIILLSFAGAAFSPNATFEPLAWILVAMALAFNLQNSWYLSE